MKPSPQRTAISKLLPEVPPPLAEYADRLLISTGLQAEDALSIATGRLDPPAEMEPLARAIRAGWELDELTP
ncbi:MAG: hypothetical protein JO352_35905 [Chloroflexi bacterium]|nr:hypothetical protein [Chloroflexota bacterium]